jgi:general secretion pathway protein C
MVRMLTKHFWVIHLIFLAAVAWLVAHLFVVIIQDRLTISPQPSPAGSLPPFQAERQESYDRYAPITASNIFNPGEKGLKLLPLDEIGPAGTSIKEVSESAKPIVPKNYKLVGTITGPGDRSYAFIQEGADRKQKIYRFREDIDGGKIVKIFRDRIIIKRQNEEEVLSFIPQDVRPQPVASLPTPTGEIVKKISPNRFLINREDAMGSVGDVNKFMTQVRMKPHFVMGQPSGYSVSEVIPGSLIEKIGLRNNDIIKKVNGQMINKPEEVFQAYSQLLRDSNIEVEIERGGRSEIFRYEIR